MYRVCFNELNSCRMIMSEHTHMYTYIYCYMCLKCFGVYEKGTYDS